VTRARNTCTR